MKTLSALLKMTVLAVVVMGAAGEAKAGFVSYSYSYQLDPHLNNSDYFAFKLDGFDHDPWCSAMTLTQTPANNQPAMPQSFTTFSLDLLESRDIPTPWPFYAPVPIAGQGGLSPWGQSALNPWGAYPGSPSWGANPASPADQQAGIQAAAWLFSHYSSYYAPGCTLLQQQELQIAIWDALYDTAAGQKPAASTGRFVVTVGLDLPGVTGGTVGADLQAILDSVPAVVDPVYSGYILKPDTTIGAHTTEVFFSVTPTSVLPESATLLGGVLLLLPFGASAFQRLRGRGQTGPR